MYDEGRRGPLGASAGTDATISDETTIRYPAPVERLAALIVLARASSAPLALLLLVVANLLPLVGVLFWGWDLWAILILYWLENGIVGALNVPRILLARQGVEGSVAAAGRLGLALFFSFHYGMFWAVHGVFVWFALPAFAGFGGPFAGVEPPAIDPAVVLGAVVALFLSHLASFWLNYLGRREYLSATPTAQMFSVYGRVVVLHLTILFGAFIATAIGSPVGALVVLVVLKTVIDIVAHVREHAGKAHPGAAAGATESPA